MAAAPPLNFMWSLVTNPAWNYCVEYDYFTKFSTVYTQEPQQKAGTIISQMNFNRNRRATLTNGGDGIAAVMFS